MNDFPIPRTSADSCQERARGHGLLLTARLSGHQVMINGHVLFPPLLAAAIPVGSEPRSRWSARSEVRTNNLGRPAVIS